MAETEQTKAQGATATAKRTSSRPCFRKQFKPQSERAQDEVETAVRTLAQQALEKSTLIGSDVVESINAMIAAIDRKLTEQINAIMHHPDFQQLESAWRGLHYLVNNTETDEMLKIRVMNISKKDLHKTLRKYKGDQLGSEPDLQAPLRRGVRPARRGALRLPGGRLLFRSSPPDVELLGRWPRFGRHPRPVHLGRLAGAAGYGVLAGAVESARPHQDFTTPDMAWRSLRESEDAQVPRLALPRFLARQPYGAKRNPVEEFDFEEDTAGATSDKYAWANAAYAMAVNINRSFKTYGWCSRIRGIESGGAVEGLPTHTFPTDDGGVDMKCPTEIAISDRREAELAKNGFMPLIHKKNSDFAAFIGAQSLQKPAVYDDPDATANANLAARLPYLFATCRFAHYLKCIVRDKIGSFKERAAMQRWLQDWIIQYVDGDPEHSTEDVKARKPLADAEVVVEEVEGNPGYYTSKFFLRPHYQLEGLTVSLRLTSKLPSAKAG